MLNVYKADIPGGLKTKLLYLKNIYIVGIC